MTNIIFHYLGRLSSLLFLIKNQNIFGTKEGREFLQMYSESEVKQLFFKVHAKLKRYKNVTSYVDKKKKSDTVFILGSGESINELTKKDWEEIKRNNIIGLNYSFVHPVIPDYHLMEMIPLREMQSFFCDVTKDRFTNVDMFFQYKHVIKSGFDLSTYGHKKNMYVHIPKLLPTIYPGVLEKYLNNLFSKKGGLTMQSLVHHNSHIGCAVMFAQALGYKKIVMLGIDLNGGNYFTNSEIKSDCYPHEKIYDKINILRTRHFDNVKEFKNNIHPTVDKNLMKDRGGVTMEDYFKVYQNVILRNSNCHLYVGSHNSTLAKILPVYDFECNK
ncbi:hypothetical protein [Mangrovimonas xylaniphaga]|uniref:hypothetical protein n=1 Tax=Mangrovimonas xylaniphaga TaxID=1645915 RepID=UPI0006B5D25F|nr:hypothetical protein [Mangrovimonas xylaniphaga]